MYQLMDADYDFFAVSFSVIVVVVVAFLGLQLFTSVLCTTSMEAKYVHQPHTRALPYRDTRILFWL